MNNPFESIPPQEIQYFKEKVTRWIKVDNQISELENQIKELKKVRNKELEPEITEFMNKYNVKDLNTENGKIKCSARNTKKGLTPKYIQEKLTTTLENNELVEKAMENILEDREIVTKHILSKVKNK